MVSIIIPVYNGSNFLREAINSALSQTYSNCEILVINDGSNDDGRTEKIAKSFDGKIRYFSKANGGVSSALNLGIESMRGEYFSWLSHDDVYLPRKVETQIEALERLKDKNTLSLCAHTLANESLKKLTRQPKNRLRDNQVLSGKESLDLLFKRGTFNGCALLLPKRVFDVCGLFDETLRFNQDSYMWYKIFLSGFNLVYTPYQGVMQRTHSAQLTQTGQSTFRADCIYISAYLLPQLLEAGCESRSLLYWYTIYHAKHNIAEVVRVALASGKQSGLFGAKEIAAILSVMTYGKIRPLIKRVYYYALLGRRPA
ncbi:MAG: glycosyltransferase [Chloroflexi bacterium]|nr:glycosyltransferase [Chloroflexota bacterium]